MTTLPIIVKGILTAEDAGRAVDAGVNAIAVSNHGGRQLETCVSPMEVLPGIVREFRDKLTIIVDSGFRRGNDVVKAKALGAHAVMIGRATLGNVRWPYQAAADLGEVVPWPDQYARGFLSRR